MRNKNKRTVIFYPPLTYDLAQFAMFPLNYAISGLCYLQPKKSIWNNNGFETQDVSGTGKSVDELRQDLLKPADIVFHEQDLVRLYDALPCVSAKEDLIGRTWRGKIVRTNHSVLDLAERALVRPLTKLGFAWGKRYRSADKGDPLLVSWKDKIFAPIPIWGNVGMTDIRWRGEATATMNYDHQPWKDYFKLLTNENGKIVLLGVWTHKHIAGGWFTLTLDENTPTNRR